MPIRMEPPPARLKDDRKEACRTFIDQTKQLLGLASAFIVVPAGVKLFLELELSWMVIAAEIAFIASVLVGYLVMGSVTGSQDSGDYDVYRKATMNLGRVQVGTYLLGLGLFGYWFLSAPRPDGDDSGAAAAATYIYESGCCGPAGADPPGADPSP